MTRSDLNDILVECAQLRNCYPLMHRTLSEFNWFCSTIIFGWTEFDQYEMDKILREYPGLWSFWSDARDEKEAIGNRWHGAYEPCEDELVRLARAFREYCEEQYGGTDTNYEEDMG